jgi:uncharacterized protein YidB (DUF937 family)
MSLLDQIVGALAGGESGGNSALLQAVLQLINNPQTGGLEGIIRSFRQGGLGELVDSWVANGENLPKWVSPSRTPSRLAVNNGTVRCWADGNGLLSQAVEQ